MAITPQSFARSPLLLFALTVTLLPAASIFFCGSTCPSSQPAVEHVATVQLQETVEQVPGTVQYEGAQATSNARGWLGVKIVTLNERRALRAGVDPQDGVLILGVQDEMPAQTSGFARHDVVTHFDGERVVTSCQLKRAVASHRAGERVPVRVIRDGVEVTLYPTLTTSRFATTTCTSGCGR